MGAPSAPGRSNRRAMIMLAVGGGALLLFFLVTKVLGGGGDLSAPITVPNRPGVSPGSTIAPGPPPEETFEVFATKNPFTPLVSGTALAAVLRGALKERPNQTDPARSTAASS